MPELDDDGHSEMVLTVGPKKNYSSKLHNRR